MIPLTHELTLTLTLMLTLTLTLILTLTHSLTDSLTNSRTHYTLQQVVSFAESLRSGQRLRADVLCLTWVRREPKTMHGMVAPPPILLLCC